MRALAALTLGVAALGPAYAASTGHGAGNPATRDERIALTLEDGRSLTATLRIPTHATGRLPALMLFGGFKRAATVLDRVRVDRPVIWATFDYPFEPPRKFRFPQSLEHAPAMRAAIHGTFDGMVKLHTALQERRDVDPRRITVVGASAGAPFAVVGAARGGIPGVILVQGFADTERVVQNLIARKHRAQYGVLIEWPALWFAKWVLWYCEVPDIAAQARTLGPRQNVLLVTAANDDFIPREATEALWSALEESRAKRERLDLATGHLGVGDDSALIANILQRAMRWMQREGLL